MTAWSSLGSGQLPRPPHWKIPCWARFSYGRHTLTSLCWLFVLWVRRIMFNRRLQLGLDYAQIGNGIPQGWVLSPMLIFIRHPLTINAPMALKSFNILTICSYWPLEMIGLRPPNVCKCRFVAESHRLGLPINLTKSKSTSFKRSKLRTIPSPMLNPSTC